MQFTIDLEKYLPSDINIRSVLLFVAAFALGIFLISAIARLIFGKHSGLNHAICSAMGMLMIYAITAVIYTFNPGNLTAFLSPLPYVSFEGDRLVIFSLLNSQIPEICAQMLSMIILAFLVNVLDSIMNSSTRVIGWLISRFVNVVLAMAVHYLVLQFFDTFLPGVLVGYAPMILLGILLFMLLLGILKVILGVLLTVVNPIFGAIYAFFFSSLIGKQLSKAVLSTIIISVFVIALEYLGCSVIPISAAALASYIPIAAILMLLWFLVGHVL